MCSTRCLWQACGRRSGGIADVAEDPADTGASSSTADARDPRGDSEIYFKTTKATILRDFDRAIDLLKSIPEMKTSKATVLLEDCRDAEGVHFCRTALFAARRTASGRSSRS